MKTVSIKSRTIGEEYPCVIAAEIGINHNGDLILAKKMIDAAKRAGVDAVKFQNYHTEDFIYDRSLTYTYESQGLSVTESLYDMFKRYELTRGQLAELKEFCDKAGVIFFSTPTSPEGVADLISINSPLLKNGSDHLLNLPLIEVMGRSDIPTILSTGMATLAEIDDAVLAFRNTGGRDLILLHCVSSYPTPAKDVHLRKIPIMAQIFNCPIGFSDHTCGVVASIGAVAMGACFIEKHFTLDKNLPGPDHRLSADPEEMKKLVESIRTIEQNLGKSEIGPTDSEMANRRDCRLSCAAAKNLKTGHKLDEDDIAIYRPGTGIPPKSRDLLIGRVLKCDIKKGHIFQLEDFS